MEIKDILSIALSIVSLIVSGYVAYRTLLARFKGKIWPVTEVVLFKTPSKKKEYIPSIGIPCFLENKGAKPGRLDSLRLKIHNEKNESRHTFYPFSMRKDYSIFADYQDTDWFQFGGIGLFEKSEAKDYFLVFHPAENNIYTPSDGTHEISLEALWMGKTDWEEILPRVKIVLSEQNAINWVSPNAPAIHIRRRGKEWRIIED